MAASAVLEVSAPSMVTADMVAYCWEVLLGHLGQAVATSTGPPTFADAPFPLFVTWKIGREQRLRGCIGTFTPTNLHAGLAEYSITSAMRDSRFEPVRPDEIPRLHCSISLLTSFEPGAHWADWTIGLHGIRIEFSSDKSPHHRKSATYLPQVPVEQGWDHLQTIDSLLRKGGYKGPICAKVRDSITLVRFQSEKGGLSYQEFTALRKLGHHQPLNGFRNGFRHHH